MLKIIDKDNDSLMYINTAYITRMEISNSHEVKDEKGWEEKYFFKLFHGKDSFYTFSFDDEEFGEKISQKLIEEIIVNFEGCRIVDRKIKLEGMIKNILADICSIKFNITPSEKEYEFGIINFVDHFDSKHFALENYRKLIDSLEKNVKHVIDISKIIEEV